VRGHPEVRTAMDPAEVRSRVLDGHSRLRDLLSGLSDEAARRPSALPGWSRAHVLSHIEGVCLALARQARYAFRGEMVEPYDGGRPARDAAIEAGASRTAAELRRAVEDALGEAGAAWTAAGPQDWARPVRYRDGDLVAVLLSWWRELEIHTADADLGYRSDGWTRELCGHALDFLAPRAPQGVRLELVATDGPEARSYGTGEPYVVRGALADLTAWMAGRAPTGPLDGGGTPLPGLGPWP
jgi:maleylpyruvate isomerase